MVDSDDDRDQLALVFSRSFTLRERTRGYTRGKVVPLITTPSANRTREGLLLSLAFFAALSRADLRAD